DDACCSVPQEVAMGCTQIGSARGYLPIVEMDDIGSKVKLRQGIEQTPAKQEKTPLLVELIQTQVNPLISSEEFLIVKQVDGDRRIRERGLQNRYDLVESADG